MANPDVNKTQQASAAPPASNGGVQPAKVQRPPREVPTIVCSPNKDEHAEVTAAQEALMGGLKMNIALGPFVLACALAEIRKNPAIQAALKGKAGTAPAK